jgi:[ribosomal protein S5]-alanine N-acetyltransferase
VRDPSGMPRLEVPTLKTPECTLRPWTLEDFSALREAGGDEDICRFTTVPRVYSKDAAIQWIGRQHAHASDGTAIVLALVAPGSQAPVGMIGLFGLDQAEPVARFGYWLIARARGQGLVKDAARALGDWAFACLGIDALIIDCEPINRPSARVAAHLGAALIGSQWVCTGGTEVELHRYRLDRMPA